MNRLALSFTLILLSLSLSAQNIKGELRKGNKAYADKDYKRAEQSYRKALQQAPQSAQAQYALSTVLYKQKQYEAAKEHLAQALKSGTLDLAQQADLYHNTGNIAMQSKDYQQAVDYYKQAIVRKPEDEETRYNLALALRLLQQQQNQQNKSQSQQKQDPKDQKQQDQNQGGGQPPQPQKPQEQPKPQESSSPTKSSQMSKQQAEQILKAFESDEEQTRRRVEQRQREQREQQARSSKKRW